MYVDDLGITPARVNRETGEILLNRKVWNKLPSGFRSFILAHEEGHYVLQTTDELKADEYAFNKLAGSFKNSLKTCVETLADVLPFTTDEHSLRLLQIYLLGLKHDYKKKQSPELKKEIDFIGNMINKSMKTAYTSPYENNTIGFFPAWGKRFIDVPKVTPDPFENYQNKTTDVEAIPVVEPPVQEELPVNENAITITIDKKFLFVAAIVVFIILIIK